MHIAYEDDFVRICPPFLECRLSGRIDVHVVHSAERLEERAGFVGNHCADVKPIALTGRDLDVIGRLRSERHDSSQKGHAEQAQSGKTLLSARMVEGLQPLRVISSPASGDACNFVFLH